VNVSSYLHGVYPRSDRFVRASRDYQRGRAPLREREAAVADDVSRLVSLQREAGIGLYSDGLLGWQDIFRPLVEATPGLRAGGLVRWFDTNSFYRAPQPEGALAPLGALELTAAAVPRPWAATLPGPFLFSRACQGPEDPNVLLGQLATAVLRPAADDAVAHGCKLVHLEEPWLVTHPLSDADWAVLGAALGTLRDGLGAEVVLHTSFGDAGPVLDRMRRLPVDAIGVDLVQTDPEDLGTDWKVGLVAGCSDGRNSLVESTASTLRLALQVAEQTGATSLYLTSATALELVPRAIAEAKVRVLGEVAAAFRAEVR
jgi:5-methyltetrahydropteroyltriglutamate--homocysteine methyltransferase